MTAKMLDVYSPYDQQLVAQVPLNSEVDVETAIDLARSTFADKKQTLPKYQRVAILEKVVVIMSAQMEALTRLCISEGGKPWKDAQVEVERAIYGVKLAIEALSGFEGKEVAMGHTVSSAQHMAYTFKEPIGVVVAISAFNHPLNLAVHQMIPAIAVGCSVILKPALTTPLSALRLLAILTEAGLPAGWAQVLVCDNTSAELLACSAKINALNFIGSSTVGWQLRAKAAAGTRVTLEHGGVAPVIVAEDADLSELIPALVRGAFYHAGQVCISVQRVYVHAAIVDEVARLLVEQASKLVVGDPLNKHTDVGPIINERELTRIDSWVKEACDAGAELLCGGERIAASCYAPTVLRNPPDDALVSMREVFGPVVCIYEYEDIEQAYDRANALDLPFQAAIFTQNMNTAMQAVKQLQAAVVMVNEHTAFRVDWMPFGGAKTAGLGLGGIRHVMEDMSYDKMMVIKSPML